MEEEDQSLRAIPKTVALVLAIVVLGGLVVLLVNKIRWGDMPEDSVVRFVDLIRQDQEEAAYDLMSPRYRTARNYVEFLRDLSRLSELRDAEFKSRTTTSRFSPVTDKAIVCGYLRSPNPPDKIGELPVTAKLSHDEGTFFLDALRLGRKQFDESNKALAKDCPPSSR